MLIVFNDLSGDFQFEYQEYLPKKTVNLRIKNESIYKINISALHMYGLYKNSIYDSYKEKQDLAQDIKERQREYEEKSGTVLSKTTRFLDPLHHYSVAASLGAMNEWQDKDAKIKCYMAYKNVEGRNVKIGFAHFAEREVNNKPVVYIAQADVINRGQGIGRHLMECILAHYPPETEFYVLTRIFNTDAKILYGERLKFNLIEEDEIKQLGYDNRYCGFKHSTTPEKIDEIKNRQVEIGKFPVNTINLSQEIKLKLTILK